ncbi:MAG: trehalose-6-phosphate synthase, partial [Candidatus Bathyarchaeota archaeon]
MERKIIMVSNRLPVRADMRENHLYLRSTAGGLATGLGSVHQKYKSSWIGWPGTILKEQDERQRTEEALSKLNYYPVFLNRQELERYYYGFSNKTIWP